MVACPALGRRNKDHRMLTQRNESRNIAGLIEIGLQRHGPRFADSLALGAAPRGGADRELRRAAHYTQALDKSQTHIATPHDQQSPGQGIILI
jgi:hypothetical protein